jgi:threonine aldolase
MGTLARAHPALLVKLAETQHAISTGSFDLAAVMQRVVDQAQAITQASGAVIEFVYMAASGSVTGSLGLAQARHSDRAVAQLQHAAAELHACGALNLHSSRLDRGEPQQVVVCGYGRRRAHAPAGTRRKRRGLGSRADAQ